MFIITHPWDFASVCLAWIGGQIYASMPRYQLRTAFVGMVFACACGALLAFAK